MPSLSTWHSFIGYLSYTSVCLVPLVTLIMTLDPHFLCSFHGRLTASRSWSMVGRGTSMMERLSTELSILYLYSLHTTRWLCICSRLPMPFSTKIPSASVNCLILVSLPCLQHLQQLLQQHQPFATIFRPT